MFRSADLAPFKKIFVYNAFVPVIRLACKYKKCRQREYLMVIPVALQ